MSKGVTFRKPVLATDLKRKGSQERLVASNGEINASDKRDLLQQSTHFMEQASQHTIISDAQQAREIAQAKSDMVTAAFESREALEVLGATLADDLYQAANREGFMRRFLARQELSQGNIPRVKMRGKNVVAVTAGGPTQVLSQTVRDKTFYPTEFNLIARPFIEEREIQQSISDVLEEKFVEAQEAIMVQEDRLWYQMATATVGQSNEFTTISGTLTPSSLMHVKSLVSRWNIPTHHVLMASDLWNDIVGDNQFSANFDPVSKHELLLTGQIASIYGLGIYTDAYRHEEHKVLNQGEFFVIGAPENHGIYTDRGGVTSTPTDIGPEQRPGRGWALSELISMTIANPRSVAKARRV